jgi:hypothetical protein
MKKTKAPTTKTRPKKSAPRKRAASVASTSAAAPPAQGEPLTQQPQSKQQAAISSGMFLYTDDNWSLAYFADDDLHCLERQLFA